MDHNKEGAIRQGRCLVAVLRLLVINDEIGRRNQSIELALLFVP